MGTVALIDDCIYKNLYSLPMENEITEITPGLCINKFPAPEERRSSHGTFCSAIIKQLAPKVVFRNIKITNSSHKSTREQLVRALHLCSKQGIKLVNLSMGTVDYRDFENVAAAARKAASNGVIIVAAYNNYNIYTCPASLPCVFGVKSLKTDKLSHGMFVADETVFNDGSNFAAFTKAELVDCYGCKKTLSNSNSYAAPVITAAVHNILVKNPNLDFESVKKELYNHAANIKINAGALHKITPPDRLSVPAIATFDADAAFSLCKKFKVNGYNVLLFSDNEALIGKYDGLLPINLLLPQGESCISKNTLSLINYVYTADISICWLSDKKNMKAARNLPFDAIVHSISSLRLLNCTESLRENEFVFLNNADTLHSFPGKVICSEDRLYEEITRLFISEEIAEGFN